VSLGFYKILPHSPLAKGGAEEVGNKAWNLMRMTAAGLPVPAAFVLPTAWCQALRAETNQADLSETLSSGIAMLEASSGLGFGSPRRPLLVSIRSGGAVSMPGMLETVLNIGLNGKTVEGLIGYTGNPRLAWDCYRRLVQGYAEIVERLPRVPFDALIAKSVSDAGVGTEHELDYRALRQLTLSLLDCFQELAGVPFPDDPNEQLRRAALAIFQSWDGPKAVTYRAANGIEHSGGTAVTVQRMVFGNAGGDSGAGVAFTRNPATGVRELYLDFQFNAQGEDVVAGRLAPYGEERLRRTLPRVWAELEKTGQALEALFHDAQDFEFTLQSGAFYLLQSRAAKRTSWAAVRIAVDQVDEGLISPVEALARLAKLDLASVARTCLADLAAKPLAHARVASMGVASGAIALDSEAAKGMAKAGMPVILVRREMEASDIEGILSATGVLTAAGGRTSHAAVVARQLGKVCMVACPDLEIDLERHSCRIGGTTMHETDFLSLDGNTGAIYAGQLQVVTERPESELAKIASWHAAAL